MFSSQIYESWRSLQYEKYDFLLSKIPDFFDGTILDSGCGNSFLKRYLKTRNINANIIGVDIADGDIVADASSLPFPDECFEKIACIDAIHLFNPDLRVLKKGGMILASVFFNDDSYTGKRRILMDKLFGLKIIDEFIFNGRENELFVLARKIKD